MRWFLIVMLMTTFLFADMFHMVIFTENREQCSQVDFYNEHDLFSDYCADVLFRSSLRSFAILAGMHHNFYAIVKCLIDFCSFQVMLGLMTIGNSAQLKSLYCGCAMYSLLLLSFLMF